MNESREILIKKRDELIEMLQGEWAMNNDIRSINREAGAVALVYFVLSSVLWIGLILCVTPFIDTTQHTMTRFDFIMSLLIGPALGLIVGFIAFCYLHASSAWYRRLGPVAVTEHHLV